MKKLFWLFVIFIFTLSTVLCQNELQIYYRLNMNYDNGEVNISSLNVKFSNEKVDNDLGFYVAEIIDFEGNFLDVVFFVSDFAFGILYLFKN